MADKNIRFITINKAILPTFYRVFPPILEKAQKTQNRVFFGVFRKRDTDIRDIPRTYPKTDINAAQTD